MANLSATLTAELNYLKEDLKWQRKQLEMSIIDPDYFKRRPPSEDEMDDEYSRFLYQVDATTRYENFVDALEKELELEYLHIQDSNSHYAESIRPPKNRRPFIQRNLLHGNGFFPLLASGSIYRRT